MRVACEINDYSNPAMPCIRVHNAWNDSNKVELEVDGKRYTVVAEELISAINRVKLGIFGY